MTISPAPDRTLRTARPPAKHRHPGPSRKARLTLAIAGAVPLLAVTALAALWAPGAPTDEISLSAGQGSQSLTDTGAATTTELSSPAGLEPDTSAPAAAPAGATKVPSTTKTPAAATGTAGTGSPATGTTQQTSAKGCTVSANLVPSCGAWWGVSPDGHRSPAAGVADFELITGARTDMYRGYHQIGDMFPDRDERAIARDPQGNRILLLSLKPTSSGKTWRQIAAGAEDPYLDRLAVHIKTNFREKFLFVINHEPEHMVQANPSSGMTAVDFRDMFRHIAQRLDSKGATNALFTMVYQGSQVFKLEPWWPSMYPGDDVVDWMGWDSYSCVRPDPGQPCNDFGQMMNRRFSDRTSWQGMYAWAAANHPGKPIVVAEMGIYDTHDTRKANVFRSAIDIAPRYPAVKAISYWNSGTTRASQITSGPGAIAAAAAFAQSPHFRQSYP